MECSCGIDVLNTKGDRFVIDGVIHTTDECTLYFENDPVNHPKHYTEHPSGIECIQITEHMNFCLGNAMKYIWRADGKNGLEDLEKAAWYINREIERRKNAPQF